jgi:excinuclease UvrABC ATPase subunit
VGPARARRATLTGEHLDRHQPLKTQVRERSGEIRIEHATRHNLQDVSVTILRGADRHEGRRGIRQELAHPSHLPAVEPAAALVDQRPGRRSRRSNPATSTGMLDPIRKALPPTTSARRSSAPTRRPRAPIARASA